MSEVQVVDQAGSVGFVSPSDRRGFELNPQAWTDMNSVRMDEGAVEPAWGYASLGLPQVDSAHSLDYMSNTSSDKNFYVTGNDTEIRIQYVDSTDPGVYIDKVIGDKEGSGYTGVYDAGDVWVTAHKDGHMVMTNGRDRPQMILQTADGYDDAAATNLTGFDAPPSLAQDNYIACKTIIAFRGFLVAGGMTFSSSQAPQMIAWSDRTDTGSLPSSWDYADPATLAGNVVLPADYGDVIALKEIRDELMVYCERGAYRMQWVGGQYVFRIVPAYDVIGALNPRSLCSVKGSHIIVTYSDIVRTDGQYPESIANGTVRKELFEQLAPENYHKIQVTAYPKKSEVIIICPDKQDDKWCGKALVWNWSTGVWAVRHGLLMRCMSNLPKLISAIDPTNKLANSTYDEVWRSTQDPPITDGTSTPPPEEQLQTVGATQFVADYHYVKASSGSPANDGWIIHSKVTSSVYTMKISKTDYHGADRSADLETLLVRSTISVTPFSDTTVWTISAIEDHDTWVYVEVVPVGFLDLPSYNEDTFTFDTPESVQILSEPEDQPYDNYSQLDSTFGTLLADEGTLHIFGIATAPEEYFPSQPLDSSNNIWQFDSLQLQYNNSPDLWLSPFVERRGINLTNDETVQVITAVYPKMEGPGRVLVHVGAVDFIGGEPADIRWDPAVLFDPTIHYRITCRTAGRRHAIKFEAVKTGAEDGTGNILNNYSSFRLAGYDIEYAQSGRR